MCPLAFDSADQLREVLFTIIESLPGGLLLADDQGRLLAANQQAVKALGLAGSAILDRSCWELLDQCWGITAEERLGLQYPGGRVLCQQRRGLADDESRCWLIARNDLQSPFLGVSGFFLSLTDTTYPSLAEARLARSRRLAAMQEMAVTMSQDLKNPLGSLALYASLLGRELAGDPDCRRLTGQMRQVVRTMAHRLDNFVTFARLPSPRPVSFRIESWLREMETALAVLAGNQGVRVVVEPVPSHLRLYGDRGLLGQLLLNLGINGIESMTGGGALRISNRLVAASRQHPPFFELRVRDQGAGMAPEQLARIFDPFHTTRDRHQGLGLAIVHHIVEVHDGLIKVESQPGKGSTFTVLLPYTVPDQAEGVTAIPGLENG